MAGQAAGERDRSTRATTTPNHLAANVGAVRGPLEYSAFVSQLMTDNREPNNANRTHDGVRDCSPDVQIGSGGEGHRPRRVRARPAAPGPTAFGRPDMDAFFEHTMADFLARMESASRLARAAAGQLLVHQDELPLDEPGRGSAVHARRSADLMAPFQSSDFLYDSETERQAPSRRVPRRRRHGDRTRRSPQRSPTTASAAC